MCCVHTEKSGIFYIRTHTNKAKNVYTSAHIAIPKGRRLFDVEKSQVINIQHIHCSSSSCHRVFLFFFSPSFWKEL